MDTTVKVDFQVGIPNRIRQDKPSILPGITRLMALSLKYNDLYEPGVFCKKERIRDFC